VGIERVFRGLLQGRFLGHPIHVMLVHFPAGLLPFGFALDAMAVDFTSHRSQRPRFIATSAASSAGRSQRCLVRSIIFRSPRIIARGGKRQFMGC